MGDRDKAWVPGLPAEGQESGRGCGGTISPRDGLGRREDKLLEGEAGRHALHQYYLKRQGNPNISACSSSRVHMEPAGPASWHGQHSEPAPARGTAANTRLLRAAKQLLLPSLEKLTFQRW